MATPEAPTNVWTKLQKECQQLHGKATTLGQELENWPTTKGMGFLQVKNHALLNYIKMEVFFARLKLESPEAETVKDHAVFTELVRFRTLLERMRPLDRKMKYQVDKLLRVATSDGQDLEESLQYAPKPDQLVTQDEEGGDAGNRLDGEVSASASVSAAKDGIYRAPRLAAMHYEEEERAHIKQAKQEERNRKRMQKSAILSELRDEFSERPTEMGAGGASALAKEIAQEEAEKKDYEESRFVRVVTSRKDKIRKRQREQEIMRAEEINSIDNFAGVQDILAVDKSERRFPSAFDAKKKRVGGKTGGIFAHVEVPEHKKRRVAARRETSTQSEPSEPSGSKGDSTARATKGAGKKKEVVFSSMF